MRPPSKWALARPSPSLFPSLSLIHERGEQVQGSKVSTKTVGRKMGVNSLEARERRLGQRAAQREREIEREKFY
jgi:hypothetical protein